MSGFTYGGWKWCQNFVPSAWRRGWKWCQNVKNSQNIMTMIIKNEKNVSVFTQKR